MKTGPRLTLLIAFASSAFPGGATSEVVLETHEPDPAGEMIREATVR